MAYTRTKGQTGNGTTLQIEVTDSSPYTLTTVGEGMEITPTGYENKTDDGTNFQSSAVERVFTISDGGTWDFSANRVSTDTGQAAMAAAFASGATKSFLVTLPKNSSQSVVGDKYAFDAIITKWNPSIKVDKIVKIGGSMATVNGVVFTAGN